MRSHALAAPAEIKSVALAEHAWNVRQEQNRQEQNVLEWIACVGASVHVPPHRESSASIMVSATLGSLALSQVPKLERCKTVYDRTTTPTHHEKISSCALFCRGT